MVHSVGVNVGGITVMQDQPLYEVSRGVNGATVSRKGLVHAYNGSRSNTIYLRTLSDELMSVLASLFRLIPGDRGNAQYKGYRNGKPILFNETTSEAATKLVRLLDLCTSLLGDFNCATCGKGGAVSFDTETYRLFCGETCRGQYQEATVAPPDVPVMMMRPENGRRK